MDNPNVKKLINTFGPIVFGILSIIFLVLGIVYTSKTLAAKDAGNTELAKKHTAKSTGFLIGFVFATIIAFIISNL